MRASVTDSLKTFYLGNYCNLRNLLFTYIPDSCPHLYPQKCVCHFDNLDSCSTSCPYNFSDCHYLLCFLACQTSWFYLLLLWITDHSIICHHTNSLHLLLLLDFSQLWNRVWCLKVSVSSEHCGQSWDKWTTKKIYNKSVIKCCVFPTVTHRAKETYPVLNRKATCNMCVNFCIEIEVTDTHFTVHSK